MEINVSATRMSMLANTIECCRCIMAHNKGNDERQWNHRMEAQYTSIFFGVIEYIAGNRLTLCDLVCFVVVWYRLIHPHHSTFLHWHPGPLLLTWFNFKTGMRKKLHKLCVGWNLLIDSQNSAMQPLGFGNGKLFSPTLYLPCDSSSVLGLQLTRVSERATGHIRIAPVFLNH